MTLNLCELWEVLVWKITHEIGKLSILWKSEE